LLAEARRMGVPILPLDANASIDEYRVERLAGGTLGIRLSLRDVHGISDAELDRLLAGQPFAGITDLYERARPSRALMQRLALVGALDSLALPATPGKGERRDQSAVTVPHDQPPTRGDVIAFVRQLTATRPARSDPEYTSHACYLPTQSNEVQVLQVQSSRCHCAPRPLMPLQEVQP
jgi:error-prone DNA polymerase